MTYKLKVHDPRCHYCGEPLRRETESHYQGSRSFTGDYRSKAEVQAAGITNHKVISVRKDEKTGIVWKFSTWDGESYRDDMFCSERCGYLMGRAAVRAGLRRKQKEPA